MTIDDPVTFAVENGIGTLTLASSATRNGISPAIARSLREKASLCAASDEVRCVVLTGSGPFFSVGGDIALFASVGTDAQAQVLQLASVFHEAVHKLATMPKPLVTAINGPAAGAGFSLAILGDITIAAVSAHFTAAYSAVGLTPDGGMSWTLPRLIGLRRAQDLILTNRRVTAQEAVEIGLVTQVVPDGDLAAAAIRYAERLAAGPTGALAQCRALLFAGHNATLAEQLDAEAKSIADACAGPEGREGVAAFIEKRAADFTGQRAAAGATINNHTG
ncbi:enoyl-CoA hydratase/isomerase family protein [Novosphingobium resinovorum]|uniref:enoyl-CoA hydratase/isomerase family protein n=1 Tax=Novosphingobium resinovorum TaxID=158500 RepID=UPI002ED64203|nr:enoyl-CoA hydratase-related protein [Novosphingobium resinovorum]